MTSRRSETSYGSTVIRFEIVRSGERSTIAITVNPDGTVSVAAPKGTRQKKIAAVVAGHGDWILRQQEYFRCQNSARPRQFVSGESFYFLGRQYKLKVRRSRTEQPSVCVTRGLFLVTIGEVSSESRASVVRAHLVEWYRSKAREHVPTIAADFARVLDLDCPPIQVREMRKRWGSASSTRLSFNWRIIMAPRRLVEYVVAHELCHLIHNDHSRPFWKLLERVMPDYEARRIELAIVGPKFDLAPRDEAKSTRTAIRQKLVFRVHNEVTPVDLIAFESVGEPAMPANLATTDSQTAMMYAGEVPWHGLGKRLDEPATAADAMEAAGLDYRVELHSLNTESGVPIPQRKAVMRSDTREVLGVVGNSYTPVQNHQCFGFLDGVVSDSRLRYHTAGALGKGEKVWMLAKLPNAIRVRGSEDVTEQFLLLSNSHDGSSSLRVFFTPIRVVCGNTLAAAERRGRGHGISVIHKGDLAARVGEAQAVLGFARRYYDNLEERINHLAGHYPSRRQLETYFETLYPDSDEGKNRRAGNVRAELFRLYEHGRGQDIPETKLTSWAAFNAVTEYVDHHRTTRGRTDRERASRRLDSAWFGSGARLKSEAWRLALTMAA